MVGNTKLYLAPRSHGSPLMGACSAPTMGGWWTDMWNAIEKAGSSAVTVWNQYTGAATQQQILEAQAAAATQQAQTQKYLLYAGVAVLAIFAIKSLKSK